MYIFLESSTRRFIIVAKFISNVMFYFEMAPRRHEYSIDIRQKVIQKFLNSDSQCQIATDMLLPRTSVQKMINKYEATKCLDNLTSGGRKREKRIRVDQLIEHKLKCNRRKSDFSFPSLIYNYSVQMDGRLD